MFFDGKNAGVTEFKSMGETGICQKKKTPQKSKTTGRCQNLLCFFARRKCGSKTGGGGGTLNLYHVVPTIYGLLLGIRGKIWN